MNHYTEKTPPLSLPCSQELMEKTQAFCSLCARAASAHYVAYLFLGSCALARSIAAKIFLQFVALILRNRMFNLLKEEMPKLNVKRNYLTVPSAIRELDTMEMTRYVDLGGYCLTSALTKSNKVIFTCLGMDEDDVIDRTKELSKQLARCKDQPVKFKDAA